MIISQLRENITIISMRLLDHGLANLEPSFMWFEQSTSILIFIFFSFSLEEKNKGSLNRTIGLHLIQGK